MISVVRRALRLKARLMSLEYFQTVEEPFTRLHRASPGNEHKEKRGRRERREEMLGGSVDPRRSLPFPDQEFKGVWQYLPVGQKCPCLRLRWLHIR